MHSDAWLALVTVHLAATWAMAGILLTIHFVHYPLFGLADPARYEEFQSSHMRRISGVLVVPWGVEVLSAGLLVIAAPDATLRVLAVLGILAVAVTLGLTAFWAAPVHQRMLGGYDADQHRSLLRADLARTVIWLGRGTLALVIALVSITA